MLIVTVCLTRRAEVLTVASVSVHDALTALRSGLYTVHSKDRDGPTTSCRNDTLVSKSHAQLQNSLLWVAIFPRNGGPCLQIEESLPLRVSEGMHHHLPRSFSPNEPVYIPIQRWTLRS